jgi:hypothetical protein
VAVLEKQMGMLLANHAGSMRAKDWRLTWPRHRIRLAIRLMELTPAPTAEIEAAWATWRAAADESLGKLAKYESRAVEMGPDQWLAIVRCRDEKHQVELLEAVAG